MRKHLLALGATLALSPCLLAQKIGVINSMSGDGSSFTDHEVHAMLRINGIRQIEGEWFRCSASGNSKTGSPRCILRSARL